MKTYKIILFVFCILSYCSKTWAQTWIPIQEQNQGDPIEMRIINDDASLYQVEVRINGLLDQEVKTESGLFHQISLGTPGALMNSGDPQLPLISRVIAIPAGKNISVSICNEVWTDIEIGKIFPTQIPLSGHKKQESFCINEKSYTTPFLPTIVNMSDEQTWCGVKNVNVTICPFKYYPKENKLSVLNNFVFRVDFGQKAKNTSQQNSFEKGDNKGLFDNTVYSSKKLNNEAYNNKYLIIVGEGEHLDIIGSKIMKEFRRWKALKGFDTKVVSISTILSSLPPYNYQDAIKEYIREEVGYGGCVLLVGDNDMIPMAEFSSLDSIGKKIKGDYWYGCIDGNNDREADVAVGRFSVNTYDQFAVMVRKTMKYENTSPLVNSSLLVAHKEAPYSVLGYRYWCEKIRNTNYPSSMSFDTAYGCEGATNLDVVNGINAGIPMVCYLGYGFPNFWGGFSSDFGAPDSNCTWNDSGEQFYSSQAENLNDKARAVIFSNASNTANIEKTGNMLEAFSRSLSGSPAFLGSTTDGYYYDFFNCTYAKMLYDNMLINGDSLLGELTNLAHISNMNKTGSYLAIDNTFSYICGGDPALELWTDTAHVFGTVGLSEYNGNVKITTQFHGDYNVCVASEGGELVGVYPVISGNSCTFPCPSVNCYISVIKHNYVPYIMKYDVNSDVIQNETITMDSYYHHTPIEIGYGVSMDMMEGPVVVKKGTKLVIERGSGSVFFDNDFECEKGGLLLIK